MALRWTWSLFRLPLRSNAQIPTRPLASVPPEAICTPIHALTGSELRRQLTVCLHQRRRLRLLNV